MRLSKRIVRIYRFYRNLYADYCIISRYLMSSIGILVSITATPFRRFPPVNVSVIRLRAVYMLR